MPDAKDGTAGTLVSPVDPDDAHDADDAQPGEVEKVKEFQRNTGTGKYGTQKVQPFKKDAGGGDKKDDTQQKKTGWIEFVLVDDDGNPVAGEPYTVDMPDGTQASGSTGADGKIRYDGIPEGNCKLTFTQLDQDAWTPS